MMECDKCSFWNGKICTDEAEYINRDDGGPCCRYHINATLPVNGELKRLLSETTPYLKCALAEAKIRHDQTLDFYSYERVKYLNDLLDKIEAVLQEEYHK